MCEPASSEVEVADRLSASEVLPLVHTRLDNPFADPAQQRQRPRLRLIQSAITPRPWTLKFRAYISMWFVSRTVPSTLSRLASDVL
jgi:hypothetical protein